MKDKWGRNATQWLNHGVLENGGAPTGHEEDDVVVAEALDSKPGKDDPTKTLSVCPLAKKRVYPA